MAPKRQDKRTEFSREKAKLALDKILKRYGMDPPGQPEVTERKLAPLAVPKVRTKDLLPEPSPSEPDTDQKPLAPIVRVELGPPLDFEWHHHSLDAPASANTPALKEATRAYASDEGFADKSEGELLTAEYQGFHYLIRISECAVILHCQVAAESAAEAMLLVQRIPNLIEWRQISAKELAELTESE